MTVQNGIVFKDIRIVIPTSVRKDIFATVHCSHQGIQDCIRRTTDAVILAVSDRPWVKVGADLHV